MDVHSFVINGHPVDVTLKKGFVSYTFEVDGKTYGAKIKAPSRSFMDAFSMGVLIATNVYESIDKLK